MNEEYQSIEEETPQPQRSRPGRPRRGGGSVDITPTERTVSVAGATRRRAFRPPAPEQTTEAYSNDGVTGSVTHSRPGTIIMYKPTAKSGFQPRTVSESSRNMLLNQGWDDICPDCQGEHLDRQGRVTNDPNACNAREPVAVRVCPVCRKRLYDNMSLADAVSSPEDEDDPNVLNDNPYAESSTPETRTKLKLDLHIWVRHPEWAQANGVPPLPVAFREMVEGAQGMLAGRGATTV